MLKVDSQLHEKLSKNSNSTILWLFTSEQIGKVKKPKWVPCKLTKSQKNSYHLQQRTISHLYCYVQWKVDFIHPTNGDDQLSSWGWEAPKHFPKPNLHQKMVMVTGALVSIWPSTAFWIPVKPLYLRKHTKQINERHWKMQCLQQVLVNRSSSSPWQHPTAHRITNTFKKLNNWATKFASPTTFTWPLAKWLKHLNSFLQGKCFPKIYWIPKHVFLLYRNKQTFLVGKNMLIIMVYILINNDVWT